MTRIMKRLTAVLIALILLAGLLPMTAFAADGDTHAITLEFNDQYGFAKVGNNLTEGKAGYGYIIRTVLEDACLLDSIEIYDMTSGEVIPYRYDGKEEQLGTTFYRYLFVMPDDDVYIRVNFVPAHEEKQITLTTEDEDLGFLRVESGHDIAIPTAKVRILAIPLENPVTDTYNVVEDVTCTTVSGESIHTWYEGTFSGFKVYAFNMPHEDVVVDGFFRAPNGWHRFYKESPNHGELTMPAKFAQTGKSVTFTAQPDTGYTLNALYYVDRDTGEKTDIPFAENQTEFTITMPDADITVYAHFGLHEDAHSITTSCEGKLGGQINLNTYVAAPGEHVTAHVIPYNSVTVKSVVVTKKSDGSPVNNVTITDGYAGPIVEFDMPDYDVDICASYLFPTINIENPSIYTYEGQICRDATYDPDTLTYTLEVYEDAQKVDLRILKSGDGISFTVSAPAVGYSQTTQGYFSKSISLTEGTTEMTVLLEADDPNTGAHLRAQYTLNVCRVIRYVPVERIVINGGEPLHQMTYYNYGFGFTENDAWMPSVSVYPENADNQEINWNSSDNSILRFGYYDYPNNRVPGSGVGFYTVLKSGVVTITATCADGVSASMTVAVGNGEYDNSVGYDPGDGSYPENADPLDYSCQPVTTDIYQIKDCDFIAPEGQTFKAWSDGEKEYYPGDWIILSQTITFTAVYTDRPSIVWLDGDGSVLDRKYYNEGEEEPTTDRIPAKEDDRQYYYTFDSWGVPSIEGMVKTYTPIFTETEKPLYTVIWLDGDGEELDRKTYYEGEDEPTTDKQATKAADIEYTYSFKEWDEGEDDGEALIYRPIFTANEKPVYSVTVYSGKADPAQAKAGKTITLTPDEPDQGMRFTGWRVISGNITIENNTFVMPAQEVQISATYDYKKIPDVSIDFCDDHGYVGKPFTVSGEVSENDERIDVGGEMTITFSSGAPEAQGAETYTVPVTNGRYQLDVDSLTDDNEYIWVSYSGDGDYGTALVMDKIRVYEISRASLYVALAEEDVQVVFDVDEELNTDNLYIWIYWMDGSEEEYPVTPDMVSGFDSSAPGKLTLTVNCPYPTTDELT